MADVPKGVSAPSTVAFLSGSATPPAFEDLSEEELRIFDADLRRLASSLKTRSLDLASVLLEERDTLLWACSIAKKQLDGLPFRGLRALGSSTFGMQPIRPIYINGQNTWLVNRTTTGWVSAAWSINLANASGNVTNTQNRVILCAPRLANYAATPKVREIQWKIGPTTYPVDVLDWAYLGGLYIAKPIGAILISKNGTAQADFNVEFTGVDGTALFGLAFARGDWLSLQT